MDKTGSFNAAFVLASLVVIAGAFGWGLVIKCVEPVIWDGHWLLRDCLQRSSRIESPHFPPDRARSARGDPPEQSRGDGDVSEKAGGIQTRAQVDSLRSGPRGAGSPGRPDCGKAVVGEPRGL